MFVKNLIPNSNYFSKILHLIFKKSKKKTKIFLKRFLLQNPKLENNSVMIDDDLVKSRKIIAQVIALSLWRLSESIILPWNPKYLNETLFRNLMKLEPNRLFENQRNYDFTK